MNCYYCESDDFAPAHEYFPLLRAFLSLFLFHVYRCCTCGRLQLGFIPFFITNKLTQKVSLALREGRDTNAIEKDQANEKFAAKEHQNILSNDCYSEFNPSQRKAISENEKRIQDLCQKLTQCLYEQFQEKKSYDLETIEEVVQEVILQCATPEIDILFSKSVKEQNYEKRTFREQILNLWESA